MFRRCPQCKATKIRRSRAAASWFKRLLLYQRYRCEQCQLRFLAWSPHHLFGTGLSRRKADSRSTLDTLGRAAEAGQPEAQYMLGVLYIEGDGVEQNRDLGIRWLLRASEQGMVAARLRLGDVYYADGPLHDRNQATRWYRLASEAGDAEATLRVAMLQSEACTRSAMEQSGTYQAAQRSGVRIGASDLASESSITILLRAAEHGVADAQYKLGALYQARSGEGDPELAAHWFERAARQGHGEAQFALAYLLSASLLESDHKSAYEWLHQAAENGVAQAQFTLGSLLEAGEGSGRDLDAALRWYSMAGAKGHTEALEAVLRCRSDHYRNEPA